MRATTGALAALLLAPLTVIAQGNAPYSIDPAQSKLEIHVYKEGVFKAFGHDHLIAAKQLSGQVQLDPQKIDQSSVRLHVPAKSLTVVDPGESEKDRRDVQTTMEGEKVLDVAKFPEIIFSSSSVSAAKKTPAGWELTLFGKLRLHGVEKSSDLPFARARGRQRTARPRRSLHPANRLWHHACKSGRRLRESERQAKDHFHCSNAQAEVSGLSMRSS